MQRTSTAHEQSRAAVLLDRCTRLPERLPVAWSATLLAVDVLAALAAAYAAGVPANAGPAAALVICCAFALCGVYRNSYALQWRDEVYHVLVACALALVPLWVALHVVGELPSNTVLIALGLTAVATAVLHALLNAARRSGSTPYAGAAFVSPQAQWRARSTGFRLWKNAFDAVAGAVALLVLSPVMLLAAACIAVESGRPVLFRQERVGRCGSTFEILKFRTMRAGAGDGWAQPGDRRITRVGALLRQTSIDELPQLFNVLRGDMSLVGPRPEMRSYAQRFGRDIPHYDDRHVVQPGITGWAQVQFDRNFAPADAPDVLPYDLFYVEHASPVLDAVIALKTAVEFLAHRAV